MRLGFAIESSDIDLQDIDLSNIDLDLLDTDIPSKHFAGLQEVFKKYLQKVFKTSGKTFSSSKTSSRRFEKRCQNVLRTYVQDLLEDEKLLH